MAEEYDNKRLAEFLGWVRNRCKRCNSWDDMSAFLNHLKGMYVWGEITYSLYCEAYALYQQYVHYYDIMGF